VIRLLLPLNVSLHSQEIHNSVSTQVHASNGRRKSFLYVRETPFLITGVAVGLTRRPYLSDDSFIDFILAGHYHFYREFQKSA